MEDFIDITSAKEEMSSILSKTKKMAEVPWIITKVLRITLSQLNLIRKLTANQYNQCLNVCERVNNGESIQEIFGIIEFYGQIFYVDKDVFYPRLTTQSLIDVVLKKYASNKDLSVVDLCTGSGCVAITLSQCLNANTIGVDLSPIAIKLAKKNAKKLNAKKAKFEQLDIFDSWGNVIKNKVDIIVSNPPYWTFAELNENIDKVKGNPINAFVSGDTGLEFYEEIIKKSPLYLKANGMLFLEIDSNKKEEIRRMLEKNFEEINFYNDHLGDCRVVSAKLKQMLCVSKQSAK